MHDIMKSVWTGTLGFGLVNIPVRLGTAAGRQESGLHKVRRSDGSPLHWQAVAEADGKPVGSGDIAMGYRTAAGQTVIVTDADLDAAYGPAAKEAKILMFADAAQVPPRAAHDSAYLVEPDKGGARSYELLRLAMERTGKVAVVSFAMRARGESLGILSPVPGGYLMLERLQWAANVRTPDFEAPSAGVSDGEIAMAENLVKASSGDFDWASREDPSAQKLDRLLRGKIETGQVLGTPSAPGAGPAPADLTEALRKSVEAAKAARQPAAPARRPRAPRKARVPA